MTTATLIKENISLEWLTQQFRGLVHYHHGRIWQHAGRDGAGERAESSYILTCRKQEVVSDTGHDLSIYEASKPTPTMTDFFQQDHTYSNIATPPNTATLYELMGAKYFETTTVPHVKL